MTQTNPSILLAQPPAPTPRALTARARRRSWVEPRVRAWWMPAFAVIIIAGWLVSTQLVRSAQDRKLIRQGVRVDATVEAANGNTLQNKTYPPEERAVFKLSYSLPGNEPVVFESRLKDQRATVTTGTTIPLYVDPKDPARWTDRVEPSLLHDALVGIMLLPLAVVLLAVAVARRFSVLRIWQAGQPLEAIVVETRQTAIAPLSRVVRFALRDPEDNRVFSTLIPAWLGEPQRGDAIWLVAPARAPQRALVAAAYDGPMQA